MFTILNYGDCLINIILFFAVNNLYFVRDRQGHLLQLSLWENVFTLWQYLFYITRQI